MSSTQVVIDESALASVQRSMAFQLQTNIYLMTSPQLHILVVEDNESARELIGEMLAVLGHVTSCAASAEEALEALEDKCFDVLLADINLPGMSGIMLAENVVKKLPAIHVVFASGFGYLVADKTDFQFTLLPKPYGLSQLKHALEFSR